MADADTIVLPDYIIQRNAQAQAAGLRVVRQKLAGALLTTAYQGTEAAWRASGFVHGRLVFKGDGREVTLQHIFTPDDHARFGCFRTALAPQRNGEYRIEIAGELVPESVADAGDGIMVYEMRLPPNADWHGADKGSYLLYTGARAALFDRSFAPPEAAEKSSLIERPFLANEYVVMWEWDQYGLRQREQARFRVYIDAPARLEQLELAQQEKERRDYKRPADMLEQFSRMMEAHALACLGEYTEKLTQGRQIYTLAPESVDAIREVIDELRQTIVEAQVYVKREATEPPRTVRADPAFAQFMAQAIGDQSQC